MPGFLGFTRRERQALVASGCIALGAVLLSLLWRGEPLTLILSSSEREVLEEFTGQPAVPDVLAQRAKVMTTERQGSPGITSERAAPAPFDPNIASPQEMEAAGMPQRLASTIVRYREKGGRFRRAEDLLKLYGMSDSVYARVLPWVAIPERSDRAGREEALNVEINSADEETFKLLPGIGSGYAARICKFRNALGGFHTLDQLAETFGLPDSVFQRIRPRLTLQQGVKPLRINELSADSLARHPYISPKQARVIVNYRTNHGPFRSLEELERTRVLSKDDIQRLTPDLQGALED